MTFAKCPWWQIDRLHKDYESGDPDWELLRESWLAVYASWGIVFNSFSELEQLYIDYMKTELGHQRVWAVGPVLSLDKDVVGYANRGGSSSVPFHELMAWLDSGKEKSVLYVCFGSVVTLTVKQMREVASSLELSRVPFVWCVRNPSNNEQVTDDYNTILKGLEERVEKGRGFVIKGWAPQLAILRHKAVGAFLTNCGWNSALEGLMTGVLLLTWPMFADQYTNAELVIDQLGLGIRVAEGERKLPEPSELARILDESMKEENIPERVKAREIKEAAVKALKGGSSDKYLDDLVKNLNELSLAANKV
ncbi:hypothetical protein HS088_TW20G00593 [Tripterygium wilfordii]|uniref:Uncharacterized protein n=2 Tax=Tripterygium wilfordii TaxID=458696 RepID=A0A7J7C7V2_TRIWF|nr:hypothetical protein HS088_TW20G00593 [Tripterygium wilfordii]